MHPNPLRAHARSYSPVFASLLALLALVTASSCHDGNGGDDAATVETAPPVYGMLLLGGREHNTFAGASARAIRADEQVVATAAVRENGQFVFARAGLGGFTGRIEVAAPVWTSKGEQTLHLSRDLDLAQVGDGEVVPLVWIGPVATMAARYRRLHPELGIAAAEQAVKDLLGIPADVEPHSGLGDSYRSPFSWSMVLAEFEAGAAATLDEHVDEIVAAVGTSGGRAYRKPPPNAPLHRALYGARSPSANGVDVDDEPFWKAQGKGLIGDLHYSVNAEFVAPLLGSLLSQLGLFPSPPSNEELLAELTEILTTVQEMEAAAVAATYSSAWQGNMAQLGPICTRIQSYTQQLITGLSANNPSPQLTGMALRTYAAGSMVQDFETLWNLLLGRSASATNGPLVSVLAANAMVTKYNLSGADNPGSALWLRLRTNDVCDELRSKQDYFLGHALLSMNLLMEWARLDPYAFPLQGVVDSNIQFNNLSTVVRLSQGQSNATPPKPGYAADMVAAMQLVPPSTIASDRVLVDIVGTGNPIRPNYWVLDLFQTGGLTFADARWQYAANLQVSFGLGPWPSGSFRVALVDEVLGLRTLALKAKPDDVRGGLIMLGFSGVPDESQSFWAQCPVGSGTYDPNSSTYRDSWLVNMDTGATSYIKSNNQVGDGKLVVAPLVRYGPSGRSRLTGPGTMPSSYSFLDDSGTAVVSRNPTSMDVAGGVVNAVPPTVEVVYPSSDNLRYVAGTQRIAFVTPFGGVAADAFTANSILVWQPDPAVGSTGFIVNNGPPVADQPFLQLTSANPTGNLVGELYTGYTNPPSSIPNNRRAEPLRITIPVAQLVGQSGVPGSPPAAAPVLSSVWAVPSEKVFVDPTQLLHRCYATGFYNDAQGNPVLLKDHTLSGNGATVTWAVTSGPASFDANTPNLLVLNGAPGQQEVVITVTVTAGGVTVTDSQRCYTRF